MTKVIDFGDGFTSSTEPATEGSISSFYSPYANDAAYEAIHTAVNGSCYYDTTLDVVKVYDGATWRTTERALDNATTSDPGASNDNTEGYEVLSLWLNTSSGAFFRATDVSTGAAVWQEIAADSVLDSHISATAAHGATGAVVGTTNSMTLTNKTFDDEITLQEIATPSTPSAGYMKVYPKADSKMYKLDDTGAESELGGGGGGSLEVFYQDDYGTNTHTYFSVTGDSATPDNAGTGTMSGTLLSDTSTPIAGDRAIQFLSNASGTNDFFLSDEITLDDTQNGRDIGVTLFYAYGTVGAADGDMKFLLHDATNDVVLSSDLDLLEATDDATTTKRFSTSVFIPKDCTSIRYGFQRVAGTLKTLEWSNVEFSTNPFVYKDLIKTNSIQLEGNDGRVITALTEDVQFSGSGFGWTSTGDTHYYEVQNTDSVITFSGSVHFTTGATTRSTTLYLNGSSYKRIGLDNFNGGGTVNTFGFTSSKGEFSVGDQLSFRDEGGGTLNNTTLNHYLNILEQSTTEHVVTPAKSSATTTNVLTSDVTTTGDITDLRFTGLTLGDRYLVNGIISHALSTNGAIYSNFENGSTIVGTFKNDDNGLSGGRTYSLAVSFSFIATDTQLDLNITGAGGTINGNGTNEETFLQLTNVNSQFLAAVPIQKVAYVKELQSSGTDLASTANTVQTRVLNTIEGSGEIVSLLSNQFTLNPGQYNLSFEAPSRNGGQHQAFLYNVTDLSYDIDGASMDTFPGGDVTSISKGEGVVTITAQKTYEIRHWTEQTRSTGLGKSANGTNNPQTNEVYTQVKITKLR